MQPKQYNSSIMTFRTSVIYIIFISFLVISCSGTKGERSILPDGMVLADGDIVFRRGTGLMSHTVVAADGGRYSHVGIVVDSAGVKMIVHAVPDEPDFPGDIDRVKMESPRKFFSTINANVGEVMRHTDKNVARVAAREAMRLYRCGFLFDHDYDDNDSTKLYCSELVERAYLRAGVSLAELRRHDFSVPGFHFGHVIMPSDIYISSQLRTIARF